MVAILVHGRQVEWCARLDFLWQLQASQEKREMSVLQQSNKSILHNLLPSHVAAHFLNNQFRSHMVSYLVTYFNLEINYIIIAGYHITGIISPELCKGGRNLLQCTELP